MILDRLTERIAGERPEPRTFAAEAAGAFRRAGLHETLAERELFDIIFADGETAPAVHGGRQIVVLRSEAAFSVCGHLWADGYVCAHHHAWSGAYQVLRGEGLHVVYGFHEAERLDDGLCRGELIPLRAERIGPGTTVEVEPGPGMIHGFSYIPRSGLTVSIRSAPVPGFATTEYLHSGLAIEPGRTAAVVQQQGKALDFLAAVAPDRFRERLVAAARGPLGRAFALLRHAVEAGTGPSALQTAVEAGHDAHGERFAPIATALADVRAQLHFARIRGMPRGEGAALFTSALGLGLPRGMVSDLCGPELSPFAERLLEAEGHPVADRSWSEGVLPVLRLCLRHRCEADVLAAAEREFDVDAETQPIVRALCRNFAEHPLLGPVLFDRAAG